MTIFIERAKFYADIIVRPKAQYLADAHGSVVDFKAENCNSWGGVVDPKYHLTIREIIIQVGGWGRSMSFDAVPDVTLHFDFTESVRD